MRVLPVLKTCPCRGDRTFVCNRIWCGRYFFNQLTVLIVAADLRTVYLLRPASFFRLRCTIQHGVSTRRANNQLIMLHVCVLHLPPLPCLRFPSTANQSDTTARSHSQQLYLFNVPETLPRFALEHRVLRPARGQLASIFWSGADYDGIAGLGGWVMRGRTDGAAECHVVGPKGLVGECAHPREGREEDTPPKKKT